MSSAAGGLLFKSLPLVFFSPPPTLALSPVKRNLALNGNRGSSDQLVSSSRASFLSSLSPQQSSTHLPGIQGDLEKGRDEEGE